MQISVRARDEEANDKTDELKLSIAQVWMDLVIIAKARLDYLAVVV